MISIIIPCYNSELFIEETLFSVLNQGFKFWECIIVNNGSTDGSEEIINSFLNKDSRFKLINCQNKGVSFAKNIGIKNSKGKYIQLLDSDDLLGINKLQFQFDFLEANRDVDVVYSGARYFSGSPSILSLTGRNGLFATIEVTKYDSDLIKIFSIRNPFVTPSPLYRRSVFSKVGEFDIDFDYLEDWDFQIRCALKDVVFQNHPFDPETGVFIRLREGCLMSDRSKVILSKKQLYKKYPDLFEGLNISSWKKFFSKTLRLFKKHAN